MSSSGGVKRKFNSSSGGGNKVHGQRTPRSHANKLDNKQSTAINQPLSIVSSEPNEWFRRLKPEKMTQGKPVKHTVSIAFPSSIVRYAQTRELKTYLVGQIARACSMHEIDEIIIFVDSPTELLNDPEKGPSVFICKLLQYLEAPSYLRKEMFPVDGYHLKYAPLLPPLDMPHHMRKDDNSMFREGLVIESQVGPGHSLVNVGLTTEAVIDYEVPPGTRVTVQVAGLQQTKMQSPAIAAAKYIQGEAVAPTTPRTDHGMYWGYTVRLAKSFSAVWSESPYLDELREAEAEELRKKEAESKESKAGKGTTEVEEEDTLDMNFINPDHVAANSSSSYQSSTQNNKPKGYDLSIAYSERGSLEMDDSNFKLRPRDFRHMLIVFGGMTGIEGCVEADETMGSHISARNAHTMFDYYLNMCPSMGSRVTRTEEAALVSLARLRPLIAKAKREIVLVPGGKGGSNNKKAKTAAAVTAVNSATETK